MASEQQTWSSNYERFMSLMAPPLKPRFLPYSTRWDLREVISWQQLFTITATVIQNFPFLHLVIDGGTQETIQVAKTTLEAALNALREKNFTVRYWWVEPVRRKIAPPTELGWPKSCDFQIVSPKNAAFHGGMDDMVLFLPPEDLSERQERWRDYLISSWVLVVWEQTPNEQQALIEALKLQLEVVNRLGKDTPWLLMADPHGNLRCLSTHKYGIVPLPEEVRRELAIPLS